jgi:thymidylate kinase
MGKLAAKIVLTGGPCAGKTTALSRIEVDLTEKGYRVLVISESATELIKGGIKPFGLTPFELLLFQRLILEYQMNKERLYETAVSELPDDEECVIICDRGVLDNKAYIGQEKFTDLLEKMNLNELSLMDNYDLVIHLVTAADGKEEYYTLSNNSARTETVEEAKILDGKTANAWVGHNNLKIIDNSTEFEEKISRVLYSIHNLLGNPYSMKKQRKFTIDLQQSDLSFINDEECTKIKIDQTYFDNDNKDLGYENRLRKRTYSGGCTYYLTVQKKQENGLAKVVTDKKISEKEYLKLLSTNNTKHSLSKTRYTFIKNKQYLRLDVFDHQSDLAILEIEPTDENDDVIFPDNLHVIEEVTNNPDFQNIFLAKQDIKADIKRLNI